MNWRAQEVERSAELTFHSLFPEFDRHDLWNLAWLALVVRLVFLIFGLQTQDIVGVSMWANDSWTYRMVADFWLHGDPEGQQKLLIAGPGYGLLLACSQLLFGSNPWPPLILNIALGVMAPVIVYLTALTLLHRRSVALTAGIIGCISWTGVSLSVSQLTDQPFFTLHALALLLFVVGLKTDRMRWFIAAGVFAGVATYIRALGQVWPIVFAFMALLFALAHPRPGRWRSLARSLWTSAILLTMVLGWSYYNYTHYGVFTFTSNGVRAAASYLAARAVAIHTPGLDTEAAQNQFGAEIMAQIDPHEPQEVAKYYGARRKFFEVARAHPSWLLESYYYNVKENVQASNYQIIRQVPQFKGLWDVMTRQARDVFNEWTFFATLVGLFLLIRKRQHSAWIILGSTFAAFTMLLGFSFWQGSRLHYPAEMAWSILFAYVVVEFSKWSMRKIQVYRARRRPVAAR